MKKTLFLLLAASAALAAGPASGQAPALTSAIRLNQVGFHPDLPKVAAVVDGEATEFLVLTADLADTVWTGTLSEGRTWTPSVEFVKLADFSGLTLPGRYTLVVPGLGRSHDFDVRPFVFQDAARAALKAYFYQRASLRLEPAHASNWARPAGHPDTLVQVHASAATGERPAGTIIRSPRGWYDAGDYNKYVVNSGISTSTLLSLYEHFPEYFDAFSLNIPESDNTVPDLLDEALWNVRWMLSMQDPNDGGVYHKLTNANFDGMEVMPHRATTTRYVVKKSTAAALDFAAVLAQAARIYDAYPDALPGLSDSLLTAAQEAWRWARRNPAVFYDQGQLNDAFEPNIETGEYGDGNVTDEFRWAAAELYVTTTADSFITAYDLSGVGSYAVPSWPNVTTMGVYSILHHRGEVTPAVGISEVERKFIALADDLVQRYQNSAYGVPMGNSINDFNWGSNSSAANQGMALIQAFRVTKDSLYLEAALANLDYLLGRNATAYSFVTGEGSRPPLNPHHRPSAADAIRNPVPGMLVGGPNKDQQDRAGGCVYPTTIPALSYIDHVCSYASNEIAINWNAPYAYLAGALEAILSPTGQPTASAGPEVRPHRPEDRSLRVMPNPLADEGTVTFTLPAPGTVSLTLHDTLGREVARPLDEVSLGAGPHRRRVNLGGLPSGVYYCRLFTGGLALTHAFVVAH